MNRLCTLGRIYLEKGLKMGLISGENGSEQMYVQRIPWEVNYDESRMPVYILPELLHCGDGTSVKDAATWHAKRRPELLQVFKDVMYG